MQKSWFLEKQYLNLFLYDKEENVKIHKIFSEYILLLVFFSYIVTT